MPSCPKCKAPYKTEKWLNKHLEKCGKKKHFESCGKKKRAPISGELRYQVWKKYVGKYLKTKCFCCRMNEITPFTYYNTFQAGHIISDHDGGKTSIENLLPICRDCNMLMGSEHWDVYVERNNFPLRCCGENPPIQKYEKGIIWIQSLVRMWLERKNPNSAWRIAWHLKHSAGLYPPKSVVISELIQPNLIG